MRTAMAGLIMLVAASATATDVAAANGEFPVNTFTAGNQLAPSVAELASGGFVVVWTSEFQDGFGRGVYARRFSKGAHPVGREFRVNTTRERDQTAEGVAALDDGGFVVVWSGIAADSSLNVYGQRYSATGDKVGGEFKINALTTIGQYAAKVAGTRGGGFVIVWQANGLDGSFDGIYGQRFSVTGNKVGPEFRVNFTTENVQSQPRVAALAGGGFVVVWTSNLQDGSGNGVYGQRYKANGIAVGGEFAVPTITAGDQVASGLAALGSGGFVVVWTSADKFGKGVFAQDFSASGRKVGKPFRVNKTQENDQGSGEVAALGNSAFVVAWQSDEQDGFDYGVYGQRYTGPGAPYGKREFEINQTTVFDQGLPVVAANGQEGFVVIWQSLVQDGSGTGIFGRRFGQ